MYLAEQEAFHGAGTCGRKGSACPRGSFPLFSACKLAACVHVPSGEAGIFSTSAKAEGLETAVPALVKANSLKEAKKVAKVMAKEREKVRAE